MRAILTFHSIDDSGSAISVSPSGFAAAVRWLASGSVPVMSVAELLDAPDRSPGVAVTFDDAFANFSTQAWPLLRDHHVPVTLFIPTRRVGGTNDWEATAGGGMPSLPLLNWSALGRLAEEGVELAAHSRSHPDLRRLSDADLRGEIEGSFADIARETGRRPQAFAYPYGFFDDRVVRATRSACRWACTTRLRALSRADDRHVLPRLDSYFLRGPGRLELFGTRRFGGYMAVRAAIRRLRRR